MSQPKRKRKVYEDEVMSKALHSVQSGMSIGAASKKFNLPRSSLHSKVTKKYKNEKTGPGTIFSKQEESALAQWVLQMSERGCPITKEHLINSVAIVIKKSGKETPFVNGRPGRHWYEGFLKRHKQISVRLSENVSLARAVVSEDSIKKWFAHIQEFLLKEEIFDIDGSRIFNTDETAVLLNPKGGLVLAKKGTKNVYNVVNNNEKENLTALITANAAGQLAPTLVLMKYKRIPSSLFNSLPKNFYIGGSENGWMTAELFYEYVANRFYPWIVESKITLPVILYLDGHVSHLSEPLSKFCHEKKIHLIALPPNTTHILQPLDVSFFAAFKAAYKNILNEYRIEKEVLSVKKDDFCSLLDKVFKKMEIGKILSNGFTVCGLSPFDVTKVDFSKIFVRSTETQHSQEKLNTQVNCSDNLSVALSCIEEFIEDSTLQLFKEASSGEWTGSSDDKNLFYLWRNIKNTAMFNSSKSEKSNDQITDGLHTHSGIDECYALNSSSDMQHNEDYLAEVSTTNDVDVVNAGIDHQSSENSFNESNVVIVVGTDTNSQENINTDSIHFNVFVDENVVNFNDEMVAHSEKYVGNVIDVSENPCPNELHVNEEKANLQHSLPNALSEIKNLNNNKPGSSDQFNEYLYWPQPHKKKKKNDKDKLPSILSSAEARRWYADKKEKKDQLELEKENRKKARIEKSKLQKELKEKEIAEKRKKKEAAAANKINKSKRKKLSDVQL